MPSSPPTAPNRPIRLVSFIFRHLYIPVSLFTSFHLLHGRPIQTSISLVPSLSLISSSHQDLLCCSTLKMTLSFSLAVSVVGNRCHGSSRVGPAEQPRSGGSVGGGAHQAAAPRRLRVRPSEGNVLLPSRGHDPAHPHAQLPAG